MKFNVLLVIACLSFLVSVALTGCSHDNDMAGSSAAEVDKGLEGMPKVDPSHGSGQGGVAYKGTGKPGEAPPPAGSQ